MIAIYDEEFATAKRGLPPPSLAAMKTAAYLKTEQDDLVILITDLTNAANYNKVYFFSDKPLENLPKEIFLMNNIVFQEKLSKYGGKIIVQTAFGRLSNRSNIFKYFEI